MNIIRKLPIDDIYFNRNFSQTRITGQTLDFFKSRVYRVDFITAILEVFNYLVTVFFGIIRSANDGELLLSHELFNQVLHNIASLVPAAPLSCRAGGLFTPFFATAAGTPGARWAILPISLMTSLDSGHHL